MSYFCKNKIYVLVPTESITNEMINNSKINYNSTEETLRTSLDGTITLFKVKTPISSVFNGFEWHNEDSIMPILVGEGWTDGDI